MIFVLSSKKGSRDISWQVWQGGKGWNKFPILFYKALNWMIFVFYPPEKDLKIYQGGSGRVVRTETSFPYSSSDTEGIVRKIFTIFWKMT